MKTLNKKEKSFTIIELLVVLAIFGLLASIILLAINNTRDRAKIATSLQFNASIKHALGVDIVGEWSFNEGIGSSVVDSSDYGNNATISVATWVDSIPQLGKALNFSGNGYVKTTNTSSSLNLTGKDVAITAWVKFNSIQSGYRCIYNYHPSTGWYSLYKSSSNTLHMRIAGTFLEGNEVFVANKWYFLAGAWDNNIKQIILYINGKEDKRAGKSPTWTSSLDDYGFIGGVLAGENIDAIIDEVSVYKKAITTAQIQKLYAEGLPKHQNLAEK